MQAVDVGRLSGSIPICLHVSNVKRVHMAPLSAMTHSCFVSLSAWLFLWGFIIVIFTLIYGWLALLDSTHFPVALSKWHVRTLMSFEGPVTRIVAALVLMLSLSTMLSSIIGGASDSYRVYSVALPQLSSDYFTSSSIVLSSRIFLDVKLFSGFFSILSLKSKCFIIFIFFLFH